MPAETGPHLRTLMAWPDRVGIANHYDLVFAQREVASIANAISRYEPVWLYAKERNVRAASAYVSENVTIKALDIDQLWMRDIGPIFVSQPASGLAGIDFNFNYWGENFRIPSGIDRTFAKHLLRQESVTRVTTPLVMEGGCFDIDGKGTFLATESSILNSNRNPSLTKTQIEDELRNLLEVEIFIWLKGVKGLDITDCHVDALARFGPGRTVLLSRPNSAVAHDDPLNIVYEQAKFVLSTSTNALNHTFNIVEIEEARTVPRAHDSDRGETTTSYVNFYTPNGAVIVPQFGDKRTDSQAMAVFKALFPGRDVVGLEINVLAYEGGGIHCATQQWPALLDQ